LALRILILSVTSVLVALVASELILRIFTGPTFLQRHYGGFGPWRVYDPVLSWTNSPGYEDFQVRINSLGFRGPEVTREKPDGVTRIVCLGDSATFGVWQEEGGRLGFAGYPQVLADEIAAAGFEQIEVLNAGVVGYTSSHGLRQLIVQVLDLDPDIVTVRYGMNDHGVSNAPALRSQEPPPGVMRTLFYEYGEWRLIRLGLALTQRLDFLHPEANTVRWVEGDEFAKNLRRFAELGRERGFELLFLDYPLRSVERGESPGDEGRIVGYAMLGAPSLEALHALHDTGQEIARRVATREGVPWVETEAELRASSEPTFSDHDLVHPNEFGARIIGRILFDALVGLGWLGAAEPDG
jgi:lysophospholipase L1-like esterase